MVEQLTVNQRVVGSSPTGGATFLFVNQRVGGMEYGVALVQSDSGKHKVSIEIDLGALERSSLLLLPNDPYAGGHAPYPYT